MGGERARDPEGAGGFSHGGRGEAAGVATKVARSCAGPRSSFFSHRRWKLGTWTDEKLDRSSSRGVSFAQIFSRVDKWRGSLRRGRGASRRLARLARHRRHGDIAGNESAAALEHERQRALARRAARARELDADCFARPRLRYPGDG